MTEEASTQVGTTIARSPELQAIVLELWQQIRIDWSYASDQLSKTFRANKSLSGSSRRAIAEVLYSMIRNLRRIDYALKRGGRVRDKQRDALRLWATLVLDFAVSPDRAKSVHAAIEWDKVAAVAGAIARERDPVVRLGLAASLPDWLASALIEERPKDAESLALSLSRRAPMTVRVNTLKTTREQLAAELADAGFETSPGANCETALIFETRTNLFALPAFKRGLFEAQDEGSQLIAELVAPPPKSKIVDFCAGAGGKTLALSALLKNRGRIVATDIRERKLSELRRRAKRAGVDNVATAVMQARKDDPLPPMLEPWRRKAERVLVDAPCTGIGAMRRNPETRWRLADGEEQRFATLQLEILERALELVAPGGRLIYATCSLLRTENQDVVQTFLSRHSELSLVLPKDIWGKARATPLCDDSEQFMELRPDVHGTDGFFAAVMRRSPQG